MASRILTNIDPFGFDEAGEALRHPRQFEFQASRICAFGYTDSPASGDVMERLNWTELDQSDDGLAVIHRGQPFTGVAFETTADGWMLSETEYRNGQRWGISREWSSRGVLVKEESLAMDASHGPKLTWHDSGTLKSDGLYELGICLRERRWAPDGRLIGDFELSREDPQFRTLQLLRKGPLGKHVNNQ